MGSERVRESGIGFLRVSGLVDGLTYMILRVLSRRRLLNTTTLESEPIWNQAVRLSLCFSSKRQSILSTALYSFVDPRPLSCVPRSSAVSRTVVERQTPPIPSRALRIHLGQSIAVLFCCSREVVIREVDTGSDPRGFPGRPRQG